MFAKLGFSFLMHPLVKTHILVKTSEDQLVTIGQICDATYVESWAMLCLISNINPTKISINIIMHHNATYHKNSLMKNNIENTKCAYS